MADQSQRTIGEVINLLKDEFPEITVSKVRFLETKGLIEPSRSASGYREFSQEDISRIRFILRQQRDHFLPLKVIKSKLMGWERGEDIGEGTDGPLPETYFAIAGSTMTAEELARSAGITRGEVETLVDHDVLRPTAGPNGEPQFGDLDAVAAGAARRLLAHGLEPRHLRTLRLGAERTRELLSQLTAPLLRHGNPDTRQRAAEVLADCSQASQELQEALLRDELRNLLEA